MEESCDKDILCGVNKPSTEDVEKMDDLEKKHAVIINAPDKVKKGKLFEVEVKVGEYMEHPNKPTHFIEWLELYAGDTFLSRLNLTPQYSHYIMKTSIKLDHSHPLKAWAKCNLHGLWEGKKEIKVED
ncbi:MAG: Desulfoferredoxin [Candidatus Methanohalarchaeum thermophilum]|uniref:Desulfoferredoxin n=1 Tax=Methanohalarchaeum thermophilum TaxID=1903181 RepID=A0A1Q6DRY2_METT1|nr:MAG: Desulfoferredoxin [Candidatus Methanohalarchaeum thermophilum]